MDGHFKSEVLEIFNINKKMSCSISFLKPANNRPFPSSPGPLYQNEVRCSTFDMEMIFYSHANKPHFHMKS